jgi:fructose-bisphosphate aldolase class II
MAAADAQRAPVILAPTPHSSRSDSVKALFAACEAAACHAGIPAALLGCQTAGADHLTTNINLGCNAVHITPTQRDFPDAVAQVKALSETARQCGIVIGAMLAPAKGNDTAGEPDTLPSVAQCVAFAERAELDFLEIAIGGHGTQGKRRTRFDYERLKRVNEALGIPLMIRAEGDVLPDQIHRLIEHGVALAYQAPTAAAHDSETLSERFKAWGAAGRAAEVLAHCHPWEPVEHVIQFNVQAEALPRLAEVLETGRQRLAKIPGVRRVRTGEAVVADARFRYCWLVTFANEKIVSCYRDHPIHVDYADACFRPIASDRLTIDFRTTEN